MVLSGQEWGPLPDGSTPMVIVGTGAWQHMLELHVGVRSSEPWAIAVDSVTAPPRVWRLTPTELAVLEPGQGWTPRQVGHVVATVRSRLSGSGVSGLARDESLTLADLESMARSTA